MMGLVGGTGHPVFSQILKVNIQTCQREEHGNLMSVTEMYYVITIRSWLPEINF